MYMTRTFFQIFFQQGKIGYSRLKSAVNLADPITLSYEIITQTIK